MLLAFVSIYLERFEDCRVGPELVALAVNVARSMPFLALSDTDRSSATSNYYAKRVP